MSYAGSRRFSFAFFFYPEPGTMFYGGRSVGELLPPSRLCPGCLFFLLFFLLLLFIF